jgi:N-ethylmaleimide reductase
VAKLDELGLAYLHIGHQGDEALLAEIRGLWTGRLVLNRPGRLRTQIGTDVASALADLEAYGQMVLANPDFVDRVRTGASMNPSKPDSYFGGDSRGYLDYPELAEVAEY